MNDLEHRMRDVLRELALLAQGRTTSYNSSGGGGDADYTPISFDREGEPIGLGRDDDPVGHYTRLWNRAEDDDRRQFVYHLAHAHLERQRGGEQQLGPAGPWESIDELKERIVADGEGWSARDVANRFRCGIKLVWTAREEAGRETEFGRVPRNGHALEPDERDAEIRRMADEGTPARQIAHALELSYSTVLRSLGTKQ